MASTKKNYHKIEWVPSKEMVSPKRDGLCQNERLSLYDTALKERLPPKRITPNIRNGLQ